MSDTAECRMVFMMRSRPALGLDDLYILKAGCGRFFELGPSGRGTADWIKRVFKPFGNGFSVSSFLNGLGIMYLSDIAWMNENRSWKTVKDRTGSAGSPPFSSLEEARLKCAALGWPDPRLAGA